MTEVSLANKSASVISKSTGRDIPDDAIRQGRLDEISHQVELWELQYLVAAKMKL